MKIIIALLFAVLLIAGYVAYTFSQALPRMKALASFTPRTETYEVYVGCLGFRNAKGRWPGSESELKAGCDALKYKPVLFGTMKGFTFTEKGKTFTVRFVTKEGLHGEVGVDDSEPKTPNQALEPTTLAVTIPAAQEVAPAKVVAHL